MPPQASAWAYDDAGHATTGRMTGVDLRQWLARHGWLRFKDAGLRDLPNAVQDTYQRAVSSGQGAYLHGGNGVGKSHALVAMFLDVAERITPDAYLVSAPTMFDDMRNDISRSRRWKAQEDTNTDLAEPQYQRYGALFIDDLGAGKATMWTNEKLFSLLEYRLSNMLLTFVASNLHPREFGDALNTVYDDDGHTRTVRDGDRIASRIAGLTVGCVMTGDDRRLPKAPKGGQ
jgi:DNA replication protein DnaC